MATTSWGPIEDQSTLEKERAWLAGTLLSCVAYGIVFTLFALSFIKLTKTTTKLNKKRKLPLLAYSCLIFLSGSLFVASISKMAQMSFIDNRLFPGGPAAFELLNFSAPLGVVANVTYVFSNWMMDGMVVWRCLVVYQACHYPRRFILLIPGLAYIASLSLGVIWLVEICSPESSPWSIKFISFNVTLLYFWVSLGLNISMTIAICGRLLFYHWRASRVLGQFHGTHYTSIAAMCIESALMYSIFALLFLVFFSLDHPSQYVFLQILGEVQVIAPLLITYRVANGEAWSNRIQMRMFNEPHGNVDSELPLEFVHVNPEARPSSLLVANTDHSQSRAEGIKRNS